MEKLINPTSINASLKINEIIDELENNSVADILQGDLKNKLVVQKRNGSNSEIVIDDVENAKNSFYAMADDAGDIIRTSYLKKIDGVIQGDMNISGNYKINGNIFNEALNILKRNTRYSTEDIAFDARLKSHLHLKCVKEGVTDSSDLDETLLNNLNVGNQFNDGEVVWEAAEFISSADFSFSVTATDREDQIRVSNGAKEEIITINNVDNSLKVNGYTVEENVPKNAKFTDTTYVSATSNRDGLMSKEDKAKLDTISSHANNAQLTSHLETGKKIATISIEGNPTDIFCDVNTDTKVTNTLNNSAKAYITGTTSATTNTAGQVFDSGVFLDATPGVLCATTFRGNIEGHVTNLKLRTVSPLTNLSSANNGWFKFTGTIDGVDGNWIIFKADTLYQATNIEDPRIVLNSNNLTAWYSPYAYWHA